MAEGKANVFYAVVGGLFATVGSAFGKFAGFYEASHLWNLICKLSLFGLMVSSNTAGCAFFVKALAASSSSLPVTVISSTTNYFASALLGSLLFGERITLYWWCGTSLVLLGLLLICYSSNDGGESDREPASDKRKRL